MNLYGSITQVQNTIFQLYVRLEQRFGENKLIRELWSAMAHDVSQQISSLNELHSSFWHKLKDDQNGRWDAVCASIKDIHINHIEDVPLRSCFEIVLRFEEPVIMKVYVPIIRSLRENWTGQALNFYIMVKAHLARVTRVTESFSGDPLTIQRANLLLQGFEKEVQEHQEVPPPQKKKAASIPALRARGIAEKHGHKKPTANRQLAKHAKAHSGRTKPLIEKVDIRRRRAQR
jgi:hypothetical protein